MKIRNATHWSTPDLARIIRRVAKDELAYEAARRMTAYVGYNRAASHGSTYSSGHAPLGGRHFNVNIPSGTVDPIDFAFVVAHEMGHTRGWHHDKMRGSIRYDRVPGYRDYYAWASEFPIARAVKARRAAPSLEEKRRREFEHADRMAARWRTRIKRAQTALKRWTRRARDIERRMQLAAAKPPGPAKAR